MTTALVTADERWDATELAQRTWAAAGHLLEVVGRGAPVPALLSATPASYAHVRAGAAAGVPLAPLGTRLTVAELERCVRGLGSPLVLADDRTATLAAEVAEAADVAVHVLDPPGRADGPPAGAAPGPVAYVVHTSGTSGTPKPVPYPPAVVAARAARLAALCDLRPGAVYATSSPFHHVAGFAGGLAVLDAGATLVPVERFGVDAWQDLASLGVTHALLVPTMVDLLLEAGALLLPTLRRLVYGAAPMPAATLRRLLHEAPDLEVVQLFGQTEGTPLAALTAQDHRRALDEPWLLETVGRAVPGVELRVHQPDDGGVGELHARGPHLAHADDDAGWLHTGDLGSIDAEGFLRLAGRTNDRIVRGGENVDPVEVEEVLLAHPAVHDAAVAGVADQRWGQVVAAWLVVRPGAAVDDAALAAHVRDRLAGFKVPTVWRRLDELPRSPGGKVLRRMLVDGHR